MIFWRLLEIPAVYRLSQWLLAPGAEAAIMNAVKNLAPSPGRHLDIGCGPKSLLWQIDLQPVGLDNIHACSVRFSKNRNPAVTASAAELPFPDGTFSSVWNFGLLHHLSDAGARNAVREMKRVVRRRGTVVVFDGVLPYSVWHNPPVWWLRKLDRGRHMRSQEKLEALLEEKERWQVKRFRYCLWGHEGILCVYQKEN